VMLAKVGRRAAQAPLLGARALSSWMQDVPMGPPDSLFGLIEAYKQDPAPNKISLGIGAYRDDHGQPYVLPSVRRAEKMLLDKNMNHEYAGIMGVEDFLRESFAFAYGPESKPLMEGRVGGVQTISGTGGLRIAGAFFNRFRGQGSAIYLPNPTWGNHTPIMKDAGLDVRQYTYYDPSTCGLDFQGMLADIEAAPSQSVFLLHACAHNPTGVDPTEEQWREICSAMKAKGHVAFFDCAYQGFASGDAEKDAFAVRHFVEEGHLIMLCQSYSKNFGLYGERTGALSVLAQSPEETDRVVSQLKILVRPMFSNPPIHGARIVSAILQDPELRGQWAVECKGMADRINSMRQLLFDRLADLGSQRSWVHITDQIGMFCYSGLTPEECQAMRDEKHVYMPSDGRISMAGVTSDNVDYLAESIHDVTK